MLGLSKEIKVALGSAIAIGAAASAVLGIISFASNRKHRKMQQELYALDKQIKTIQLQKAKKLLNG